MPSSSVFRNTIMAGVYISPPGAPNFETDSIVSLHRSTAPCQIAAKWFTLIELLGRDRNHRGPDRITAAGGSIGSGGGTQGTVRE